MQTVQIISKGQIAQLVHSVYSEGKPWVKEAYSEYDSIPRTYSQSGDLIEALNCEPEDNNIFHYYAVYYPSAEGFILEKRIDLKPEKCGGCTYRFSQEGWGLIFLQCNFRSGPKVECRISVNSETRAKNWFQTYPQLQSPDLWDWQIVNRHAGRLIRLLRKLSKSQ